MIGTKDLTDEAVEATSNPLAQTFLAAHPDAVGENMAWHFKGKIDEVRISKIARYDRDFTPPLRHAKDADTIALYHFDQGSGDILKDSSGNIQRQDRQRKWVNERTEIAADASGWLQLFNGKDLTGWKPFPATSWRVENGAIKGNGPNAWLYSEQGDFEDFHLVAEFRINEKGDSASCSRIDGQKVDLSQPAGLRVNGHEAEISVSQIDRFRTGAVTIKDKDNTRALLSEVRPVAARRR